MKKFSYLNFLRGENVTIKEILEKKYSKEENLYIIKLALKETSEIIKIIIKNDYLIKPGTVIFKANNNGDEKGYSIWKKGCGSFGIK